MIRAERQEPPDILSEAWEGVTKNRGATGIDGQTLDHIKTMGVHVFLSLLLADLRSGRYRRQSVPHRYIPKPDSRQQTLNIPEVQLSRFRPSKWPHPRLYGMSLHRFRGNVRCPAQTAPRRSSVSRVRENLIHNLKGGPAFHVSTATLRM